MREPILLYEEETPDAIRERLLNNLTTNIDKQEGSYSSDIMATVATEVHKMYSSFNQVAYIVWPIPESGPYLDLEAEKLGMTSRKEGTKAKAVLTLTGEPLYEIPEGTIFTTESGLYFENEKATTFSAEGKLLLKVEAQEIGVRYNLPPHSIQGLFSNDSHVHTVDHEEPSSGGTDKESDNSLYNRIEITRQKASTSGNKYDYERWALEVDGVGAVKVFSLWQGNGTVKVLIADEQNQPVDNEIVKACKEHIEDVRPVGINGGLTVVSASPKEVSVTAHVTLEKDASLDTVIKEFKQKLQNYFASISFKENVVLFHWVGATLIEIAGVKDYSNLEINETTANVQLTEDEVPSIGEVTLE